MQSGKWYWELVVVAMDTSIGPTGNGLNFGVWPVSRSINTYIYNTSGVYRAAQAAAPGDVFGLAFDADAGLLHVRRNNVLVSGGAQGQPLPMSEPWAPVIGDDNAGGALVAARFSGSALTFAPPSDYSPHETATGVGARQIRSTFATSVVAASASVPSHSAPAALRAATARDVEHGGLGTIYGTTKTKGTPNLPTKARVVLLHQRSKQPVRETWSDPVTGAFVFTGIDTSQQFLTLVEDAAGNYRPVAASKLVPEVLA